MSRFIITFFAAFFISSIVSAQRIIGELEANTDKDMIHEDSLDQEKEHEKIVPVDIYAWNIDDIYGNRTPTVVDTLHHQFQNYGLNEGINGHYNHLGNFGSPRLNRIYTERTNNEDFIFINPFDQFFIPTSKFKFYNTKSPFLNAAYTWCGDKTNGDDHIKVTFTSNAGKQFNYGALFDYIYGQGYYINQSTAHMGTTGWVSYINNRYDLHFYYTHNHMKLSENGGILNESYITHPENEKKSLNPDDIPTWLSRTWGRQDHDIIHLNHKYNIGFTQTQGDSTNLHDVFVPVTSIFHTFHMQNMKRSYIAYNTPEDYHTYMYFPGDSAHDKTSYSQIKNIVGLSLREGFNKYAAAGLNAYIGFDHKTFKIMDEAYTNNNQIFNRHKENDMIIGGQLIRTQGKFIHYNIDGEYTLTGENSGDFNIKGHGEFNIPLLGDTAQVNLNAFVLNKTPNYYMRHYHSKHAWWDYDDFDKEMKTRIEGTINVPHTKTKVYVGIENIKNYMYFQNTGEAYTLPDNTYTISNNITPMQANKNIQVLCANLKQDFKFGILHIENDITYQTSSEKDILPLPQLSLYHNLFINFKIAKVLTCELGGDIKYWTKYYAPDYSPVMGQFMVQNNYKKTKIGNYPIMSVYANFDLKRTRFYVQYYHLNQSTGRYFWAPNYPINPATIHFGISWNFYD